MDDTRSFLFSWPVAVVIILVLAAGFGTVGYLIAAHRFKQPFMGFLVRYGIGFLFLILLEVAFLYLLPSFHSAIRNLTATLVGGILSWVGVSHSVSGSIITLQNPFLAFDIEVACLGGVLFWAYLALVLAESKAALKRRLIGIFAGLAVLLAFNFFRITLSIYLEWRTGVYVHDYFYLFNMVFVLLLWAIWLRTLRRRRMVPASVVSLPSLPRCPINGPWRYSGDALLGRGHLTVTLNDSEGSQILRCAQNDKLGLLDALLAISLILTLPSAIFKESYRS